MIVDSQSYIQNKMVDLLAQLIQVQLDEAIGTIEKISRMVNIEFSMEEIYTSVI